LIQPRVAKLHIEQWVRKANRRAYVHLDHATAFWTGERDETITAGIAQSLGIDPILFENLPRKEPSIDLFFDRGRQGIDLVQRVDPDTIDFQSLVVPGPFFGAHP
jgi:hypothetical protein